MIISEDAQVYMEKICNSLNKIRISVASMHVSLDSMHMSVNSIHTEVGEIRNEMHELREEMHRFHLDVKEQCDTQAYEENCVENDQTICKEEDNTPLQQLLTPPSPLFGGKPVASFTHQTILATIDQCVVQDWNSSEIEHEFDEESIEIGKDNMVVDNYVRDAQTECCAVIVGAYQALSTNVIGQVSSLPVSAQGLALTLTSMQRIIPYPQQVQNTIFPCKLYVLYLQDWYKPYYNSVRSPDNGMNSSDFSCLNYMPLAVAQWGSNDKDSVSQYVATERDIYTITIYGFKIFDPGVGLLALISTMFVKQGIDLDGSIGFFITCYASILTFAALYVIRLLPHVAVIIPLARKLDGKVIHLCQ